MEYVEALGQQSDINPVSIESFLHGHITQLSSLGINKPGTVTLLPHCMEQTREKDSSIHWQAIFKNLGINCQSIDAGCCGMSGLFGHEQVNNQLSDDIFKLQWEGIAQSSGDNILLASGFSCRCQLKNHHYPVMHPIQYLDQILAD